MTCMFTFCYTYLVQDTCKTRFTPIQLPLVTAKQEANQRHERKVFTDQHKQNLHWDNIAE